MAKQTLIQLVDDLSGDHIADGAGRTVRFAVDGAEYEIDLTNEHIAELTAAFEPFVQAARRVTSRRSAAPAGRAASSRETAAIREWAEAQGLPVASRGRIRADIVERYRNR